jgi:ketosteroid isomerase-like protein
MASKHEKVLRDQDAAMAKGDMDGFWAPFADDVIAHIGGRSKLAGDVKGKAEMQAKFGEFMAALGDNPELLTHDIVANDEHGVIIQSFRGTKKGKSFEARGVAIMHFSGDKISEAWFFDEDPYTSDPFYDL